MSRLRTLVDRAVTHWLREVVDLEESVLQPPSLAPATISCGNNLFGNKDFCTTLRIPVLDPPMVAR